MNYEGDVSLLSRLSKGEGRIGLLACSGGARGVIGGAQMSALNAYDLQNKFTVMVGISAGAWAILYGSYGRADIGTKLVYEECCTREYFSFSPSRLMAGTSVDPGVLAAAARSGPKQVPIERVRAYSGELYAVVTDDETSRPVYVNLKTYPDPIEAVHASSAMVVAYRRPVYVDGRRALDGVGEPLPVKEVVERWNLDGIVVFPNRHEYYHQNFGREVLEEVTALLLPKRHRITARARFAKWTNGLHYLRSSGIPYLIAWPKIRLEMFNRQPEVLKSVERIEFRRMQRYIKRAGI